MPTVISVKFKYAAHDLWFDPRDTGAQEGDHLICATERGQEIGLATMDAREVSEEHLCEVIGEGFNGKVYRIDRDNVVKTYKNADALAEIRHEREVARLGVLLLGGGARRLPPARS